MMQIMVIIIRDARSSTTESGAVAESKDVARSVSEPEEAFARTMLNLISECGIKHVAFRENEQTI